MTESATLNEKALRIFRGLAGSYDAVLNYATLVQDRRWKDWVVGTARLSGGSKVLDLGCRTCVPEQRLRGDCVVVGLDLTVEMLRAGRRKRLRNVDSLLLSDGERLPFRDGSFDVVVSCYVVKYCNKGVLVSEMARVLRPGGRLVLYDFVRPRGAFWPWNAMYAYCGLRIIGALMELGRAKSAYTYSALPGIIARRPWEVGFGKMLERSGFSGIDETLFSVGAALGFCAERDNNPRLGQAERSSEWTPLVKQGSL